MFDLTQPAPLLTSSAVSALQAVVVLLRATRGFMFLPLLVQSERAAAIGLDFLQSQVSAQFYTVSWPLEAGTEVTDQRLQLLVNLDEAIGKLPPDAVLVLNAAGSLRQDLALQVIAYINHRREPLRTANLRLVLCWPEALKNALLSNAPDLWSVRAASPWVDIVDLSLALVPSDINLQQVTAPPLNANTALGLLRWQRYRDLKTANLSPRDAFDLALAEFSKFRWHSAADLAEAVFRAIEQEDNMQSEALISALSLNLLANARSKLGNFTAAVEASSKAVSVSRELSKANPIAYESLLGTTVGNLVNHLSLTGDSSAALAAAREAVDIYRRLARANPAAYEPDLAMSINNLANCLGETGDRPGALTAAREAVAIYRRLARANPAAYEPDLAGSINNLASFLSETGDRLGALTAAREAVAIRRRLAQTNPAAYEPALAGSINNLANCLSETGDRPGALTAAREAVALYEKVSLQTPGAFDQQLVIAKRVLNRLEDETG